MAHANLIIDLQFGSTGKGLIAGYLAETRRPDTVMTAWAANAGHTYINGAGRKFVHTMLANGVVSPSLRQVLIGPGSVLDLDNLQREIEECRDLLGGVSILVHENAAVIQQRHRDEEAGPMTKIGSTKKGCGAAAIHRIRRNPDDLNTARELVHSHPVSKYVEVVSVIEYNRAVDDSDEVLIEGAQGYSLSMYHGFYPYCTSRDVSTAQVLADVGYPIFRGPISVIGTARTYPIRVANRFDDNGKQVGWSGPEYDDQEEISFADIGQSVELTTVTKLPRRIFTFSKQQIHEAIRQNSAREVFLNFANYVQSPVELDEIVQAIESSGAAVRWLGYGPTVADIRDM
jgi:adenylosuccinate synthase